MSALVGVVLLQLIGPLLANILVAVCVSPEVDDRDEADDDDDGGVSASSTLQTASTPPNVVSSSASSTTIQSRDRRSPLPPPPPVSPLFLTSFDRDDVIFFDGNWQTGDSSNFCPDRRHPHPHHHHQQQQQQRCYHDSVDSTIGGQRPRVRFASSVGASSGLPLPPAATMTSFESVPAAAAVAGFLLADADAVESNV